MTNDREQQVSQASEPEGAPSPFDAPPGSASDTVSDRNGGRPPLPETVEYRGPATVDYVPPSLLQVPDGQTNGVTAHVAAPPIRTVAILPRPVDAAER